MAKKKREIIGSPLTPKLLNELGVFKSFPDTPEDFKPDGSWTNHYRIWACHGYRESGNKDVGYLRLQRRKSSSDNKFTLNVHQELAGAEGSVNIIDAEIICMYEQISFPVKWKYKSSFTDPRGNPVEQLGQQENNSISNNVLTISRGNKVIKRKLSSGPTCNWCICESVQRLTKNNKPLAFDMLDDLTVLKTNQHLSGQGISSVSISNRKIPLYSFVHIGAGNLPFEYWLDERGRLVSFISMDKAYILNDDAENIYLDFLNSERKSFLSRSQKVS